MSVLASLLTLLANAIGFVANLIYAAIYEGDKESKRLPPIDTPILKESALEIAAKIRDGKVSSVEVVKAFSQRIREANPDLNSVVDTRFEAALKEAEAADKLVKASQDKDALAKEKPFLGVPFTTKDCFAVTGLSWTTGLLRRKGQKADFDAPTVKLMRQAGAIPIAVTNVSELCMWMESSNKIYGRTNNAYHPGRMVGGSSGGEACTVSAACSPWGIASDVGGSIRMPAFFNGIFGHKPSTGIVNNHGQLPVASDVIDKFLTTGPLCRYADDLAAMFKVLAGPEKAKMLKLDQYVDVKKLKFYYMTDDGGNPIISPVHKDLREAQSKLVNRLQEKLGVSVKRVNIPEFLHSDLIWSHNMGSDPKARPFSVEMAEGEGRITPWLELLKWFCFKSTNHTLPAIGLALLENFVNREQPDHQRFLQLAVDLRKALDRLLGEDGVLIYPSHPNPALYHGQALLRPFNFAYTGVLNITGQPVTQVPLGLGSWGVPLGVQIVGGTNADRNTLAVAKTVENLFGGWIPPS